MTTETTPHEPPPVDLESLARQHPDLDAVELHALLRKSSPAWQWAARLARTRALIRRRHGLEHSPICGLSGCWRPGGEVRVLNEPGQIAPLRIHLCSAHEGKQRAKEEAREKEKREEAAREELDRKHYGKKRR